MEMKTEACNQHTTNTVLYTGNIVGCETKKMDGRMGWVMVCRRGKQDFVFFDCIIAVSYYWLHKGWLKRRWEAKLFKVR